MNACAWISPNSDLNNYNNRKMYTVKAKLEVLNAKLIVVNTLQSCLSKPCPACEHEVGGELDFIATSVLIALRPSCSVTRIKC